MHSAGFGMAARNIGGNPLSARHECETNQLPSDYGQWNRFWGPSGLHINCARNGRKNIHAGTDTATLSYPHRSIGCGSYSWFPMLFFSLKIVELIPGEFGESLGCGEYWWCILLPTSPRNYLIHNTEYRVSSRLEPPILELAGIVEHWCPEAWAARGTKS